MNRLVIVAMIILIAGCAPTVSQSTSAQQGLNAAIAHATNAALDDQAAQQATAQAQRQAEDRAARATAQAGNATAQADYATQQAINATEQARQAIASATEQARASAVDQLTLEQAQAAATATRAALGRQMSLDAQEAQRIQAETQATITAANASAASVQQSISMRSDWYYVLPDVLMRYAPCGAVIVGLLLVLYFGRAIAARISGDKDRAEIALANPGFTVYLPAALLPPPRDNDEENSGETGNTGTQNDAGNTEGNSGETPTETVFQVNSKAGSSPALHMTREEYHELIDLRRKSIDLLARCIDYYRNNNAVDDGTIPRHDKIHMQPENRGAIVDGLWYSSFVIKTKNKTCIDPAYFPTCAALMDAIKNGRAKVYPLNYFESKQERLNRAIGALPRTEVTA